jgi:hypothetical protein
MLRYIIVFDKPVRHAGELIEAIGPFVTTGEAMSYWEKLNRPPGLIRKIYVPE